MILQSLHMRTIATHMAKMATAEVPSSDTNEGFGWAMIAKEMFYYKQEIEVRDLV